MCYGIFYGVYYKMHPRRRHGEVWVMTDCVGMVRTAVV